MNPGTWKANVVVRVERVAGSDTPTRVTARVDLTNQPKGAAKKDQPFDIDNPEVTLAAYNAGWLDENDDKAEYRVDAQGNCVLISRDTAIVREQI